MRHLLKYIIGAISILFVMFLTLLFYSYRHQDHIEVIFTDYLNSSFNNTFHIDEIHLSYIRNFPNARLEIRNVILEDDHGEFLKIGSLKIFFNLRHLLKDSIKISRITVNDAMLNSIIDEDGNKPALNFSKAGNPATVSSDTKQKSMDIHVEAPDLEIYDLRLNLVNKYKRNETYITVSESMFNVHINDTLLIFSGNLKGHLDSLKSNNTALFMDKEAFGKDLVLTFDLKNGTKSLTDGYIMANQLKIIPRVNFQKHGDGNLTDLKISSEGGLDDHLALLNLSLLQGVEQLNDDAHISISYNQNGFVNPTTRPYNQLIFEIRDAELSLDKFPYPVKDLHIIGNYNNGEQHIPETNNLIIDTLSFDIQESYVRARLLMTNLRDPVIQGHFVSELDLSHLFHYDKFNARGSVNADLYMDGRLSEIRKLHLNKKQHAFGLIELDSIDIEFKDASNRIIIPTGKMTLDNHFLRITDLEGEFNRSHFSIQAELNNLDQFLLYKNMPLTGSIQINSDRIQLDALTKRRDSAKTAAKRFVMPMMNVDINAQAQTIETTIGTIEQFRLSGALNHEQLNIKDLSFNFEEGNLQGNLQVNLGPSGPGLQQGKIVANFESLDVDDLLQSLKNKEENPRKKGNPVISDLDVNISVKQGKLKEREFNNLKIEGTLSRGEIEVSHMGVELLEGSLSLYSDIKYNDDGIWYVKSEGDVVFPYLSVRDLAQEFQKDSAQNDDSDEEIRLPEVLDINLNIGIDTLEYGKHVFKTIQTGLKISHHEIDIEDFTVELNPGRGTIDLTIEDYLKKDPLLRGNIDLTFDTLNIKTFRETVSSISSNKEHRHDRHALTLPEGIQLDINLKAELVQYENIKIQNLHISNTLAGKVLFINRFDLISFDGAMEGAGILLQNDDRSYDGHLYSKGSHLSIAPLVASFSNTDLSDGKHGNFEGALSFQAEGLFSLDSLLKFLPDKNLMYSDIIIEEGRIINNPEIESTLSFIGHKAKEDVLINNSEFQIYVRGDEIIIQDMLVNNSISNMNIFGRYNQYDSTINLDFQVSLMDLFFRTKKKRYIDTSEGQIRLFKDLSIYIELDNTSDKNKVRLFPKRRYRIRRKDFSEQINLMVEEYRSRLNDLYQKAEPDMVDTGVRFTTSLSN